jgi:hypothetical protein
LQIEFIQKQIKAGNFRITKHATIQRVKRDIAVEEICEAILCGEIIEQYQDDKYCPSVLILGSTRKQRPLHILCSYFSIPWIITAYEPDKEKWLNDKIRKR